MIIPTYHDLGFGFVLSMLLFACKVGPGHCLEKTFSSYPASPAPAILPILDKYFHISYIFFCDILAGEKVISHLPTGLSTRTLTSTTQRHNVFNMQQAVQLLRLVTYPEAALHTGGV